MRMRFGSIVAVVLGFAIWTGTGDAALARGGTPRIKAQHTPTIRSGSAKSFKLTLSASSGSAKGGKAHALPGRKPDCVERMRWIMEKGAYRYRKTKVCL